MSKWNRAAWAGWWALCAAALGSSPSAAAQGVVPLAGAMQEQDQPPTDSVVVTLRVAALLGERRASVDRGRVDGLAVGDVVWLLPRYGGRGAFLLFFLVVVAACAQIVQELASRWLRRRPVARHIDRSFSYRAWAAGVAASAALGAALWWITPFDPLRAAAMAALAGGAGTLGELVMRALKKDAGVRYWGNRSSVTGAVGLLDRVAPLCFAAPIFFHSVRWYFRVTT